MSSENHFRNMYLKHLQRFDNVAQTFQHNAVLTIHPTFE